MRKIILVSVVMLGITQLSVAQETRVMAPVNKNNFDRVTPLNKITDSLATIGESGNDKQEILNERRKLRHDARKSAKKRKKQKVVQKRIKQEQQAIMEKL